MATPPNNSLVATGLPQFPEGVPPEQFSAFQTVYAAIHNLERLLSFYAGVDSQPAADWSQLTADQTFFDGNLNRLVLRANEAISFGQVVAPILVGGEVQLRLANATNNTRWACGISITSGIIPIGSFVEIKTRGIFEGIGGMIAGSRYWVSTAAGSVQNAAPVAAGNIEQVAGWAVAPNRLICNFDSFFIQH